MSACDGVLKQMNYKTVLSDDDSLPPSSGHQSLKTVQYQDEVDMLHFSYEVYNLA